MSCDTVVLDVPVDEATRATLDPPQRRQRTLESVKTPAPSEKARSSRCS